MPRPLYLSSLMLLLAACNDATTSAASLTHVTRIVIEPDEFLQDLSCDLPGGMVTYQATLFDVTLGLDRAFELPSSKVVSCRANTNFERVVEGHHYVAAISGFARDDLKPQNPGSSIVVDSSGKSVAPDWTTTCWGTSDALDQFGGGGAGPTADLAPDEGQGGGLGEGDVGVTAYYRTGMVVRGCEPLASFVPPAPTAVAFDLEASQLGLECGDGENEMQSYAVELVVSDAEVMGGAGGATTGELRQAKCGDVLVWEGFEPATYLEFEVLGYEGKTEAQKWSTRCSAVTRAHATVSARCETFVEL